MATYIIHFTETIDNNVIKLFYICNIFIQKILNLQAQEQQIM